MKTISLIIFIMAVSFIGTIHSQDVRIASLEIYAGKHDRLNSPVSIKMNTLPLNNDSVQCVLFEVTGGNKKEVPVQVETGNETTIWWILDGITAAGSIRRFDIYVQKKDKNESPLGYTLTDKYLRITQNGENILQYNHSVHYPPEGVDTIYKRSAFIHPLWSPSGKILTRINPPDHYHHMGIWNPWTKVRYLNREADLWNLNKGQGTVSFKGYTSTISGSVFTGFRALHNHIIFTDNGRDINIMDEIWDIRIWDIYASNKSKTYLIDFVSLLSCSTDKPVTLEAYGYGGGLGFRATEEWTNRNSYVLTSEGKSRKDADASRAKWADVGSAYPDSSCQGIVFFSHPSNRDYPEPMRVWPENSNGGRGDVFFEFCPIRHNSWVLYPGKTYRQKYRMLVYDKKIDSLAIENIWNDFAYPPEVKIIINEKQPYDE